MAFGVSFLPGGDQANGQQNKPPAEPLQQAIQMLSLRLPKVVGAQGIAPGPLLQSPGGSGLAELLKQLFGQGRPMGGPSSPMPAPIPSGGFPPDVHPPQPAPPTYAPHVIPQLPGVQAPQYPPSPMRDKYDFNQQGNIGPAGF